MGLPSCIPRVQRRVEEIRTRYGEKLFSANQRLIFLGQPEHDLSAFGFGRTMTAFSVLLYWGRGPLASEQRLALPCPYPQLLAGEPLEEDLTQEGDNGAAQANAGPHSLEHMTTAAQLISVDESGDNDNFEVLANMGLLSKRNREAEGFSSGFQPKAASRPKPVEEDNTPAAALR